MAVSGLNFSAAHFGTWGKLISVDRANTGLASAKGRVHVQAREPPVHFRAIRGVAVNDLGRLVQWHAEWPQCVHERPFPRSLTEDALAEKIND